MYKIALPILGFENASSLSIEKIDDFFSFLIFDDNTKVAIANIKALNKVNFDFQVDEKTLLALKIKSENDLETYFVVVSQDPVEYSIVNLVAPIFINEKEKLVGQYVTNEKVDPCLATIDKCIKL